MNSFLKIAGPVALGISTTVAGLAVTHSPVALESVANVGKQIGAVALKVASEVVIVKLGGGAAGALAAG